MIDKELKKLIEDCCNDIFDRLEPLANVKSRLYESLKPTINHGHCYTAFAGRQQELLEFPEYIAKEHYRLVNQIGKIHYWQNEEQSKTTVQLYNDFKASVL